MGLAVIGSLTVVNSHIRNTLSQLPPGLAGTARNAAARPGTPIYDHALSAGVTTALTLGASVVALIAALLTIRIRRADLSAGLPVS